MDLRTEAIVAGAIAFLATAACLGFGGIEHYFGHGAFALIAGPAWLMAVLYVTALAGEALEERRARRVRARRALEEQAAALRAAAAVNKPPSAN